MWPHRIHLMNSVYGFKDDESQYDDDDDDDDDDGIYRETAQKRS